MTTRLSFPALVGLVALVLALFLNAFPAHALQYADMVIDARTGRVLHSTNADVRIHPASLTKMMTLYICFQAIQHGEISLDDMVTISRDAAAEPPSHLGLRPGERIRLRYLIRAAAVKSANDAATAIGEHISGSVAAFARRMNRTAKALGMTRTTFRNANGLTERGHLSTARDLTTLARHLFYDYPAYYNLFSRVTANAGGITVYNTNRKFLRGYPGADGIKTGYTALSGFNLVASARHGYERIIVTVIGGPTPGWRNARVEHLMDLGFRRAPTRVAVIKPVPPPYYGTATMIAQGPSPSLRPLLRPGTTTGTDTGTPLAEVSVAMANGIDAAIRAAQPKPPNTSGAVIAALATGTNGANGAMMRPRLRPGTVAPVNANRDAGNQVAANQNTILSGSDGNSADVVGQLSTSGERYWGVSLGRYNTRVGAEKMLIRTALSEVGTLDVALRKVVPRTSGYEANFMGLTQQGAELACRKLEARSVTCTTIGPG